MDALPVCYAGRTTRRRRTLQSLPYSDSASGEPGTELSEGSSCDAADQQPACMTALGEDLLTLVLSQLGEVRLTAPAAAADSACFCCIPATAEPRRQRLRLWASQAALLP